MPSLAVSALVVGSIAAPVNLANGLNDCPGACAGGGFNAGCAYFSDPDEGLAEQWYIEAVGACGAWELGFTGRGVTVGILDYGILQDHPDLAGQVEPAGRGGCSEEEPDPLPPPSVRDWHGTNMAGIVGAGAGEPTGMCSNVVGIAFGARLAEVFLWNGSGFDDGEIADALAYRNDCIHVKVNSYDLSGSLPRYAFLGSGAELALEESVAAGRQGLGVVFVFAAGNEGEPAVGARTDYDELVSSRRNIAVGAITPDYVRWSDSEPGSSLFCTAPGYQMFTTGRESQFNFEPDYNCPTGTSYSAPVVGAVVALMLEANPSLGWRDVMEAIVRTAATIDDDPDLPDDWQTNSAGFDHSEEHGHGLIDARAAVAYVSDRSWAPLLHEREGAMPLAPGGAVIGPGQTHTLTLDARLGMRLEHVELLMDVGTTGARGVGPLEIEIERLAPKPGFGRTPRSTGSRSVFALARNDSTPAYRNPGDGSPAVFTSVRHWGESGAASWRVRVRNTSSSNNPVYAAWNLAELRFYGTPSCVADWDMDTIASTQADWNLYNSWWQASDPRADLNGDGKVNGADMSIFVVAFDGGCP